MGSLEEGLIKGAVESLIVSVAITTLVMKSASPKHCATCDHVTGYLQLFSEIVGATPQESRIVAAAT